MTTIKKLFLFCFLLQNHLFFSQNSIIILYGCSSAGKTSIGAELLKTLPGNWKYIPSNKFRMTSGNILFWKEINKQITNGYDVIVDTHNSQFFIDNSENMHVITCLIYCSPEALIGHVQSRNTTTENPKNHRALKGVFQEYIHKFQSVKKNQPHIDTIKKNNLKNNYGFFTRMALKTIISKFFTESDQSIVYIASKFQNYDFFIDTGKTSIVQSAQKIKDTLMSRLKK